ncbi:unnamed protein product [Closterium sp. NIES-54]
MTSMSDRPSPLPPESRSGSTFDVTSDVQFSPRALKKKQKELQNREAMLRKKEEELSKREASLGIMTKNFPPFFPLIRNNIKEDVPDYLQGLMYLGFWVWMGAMGSLFYNLIPITAAWIGGAYESSSGFGNFFMALLYFILGVPGSYFFWYSRLYYAMRKDSGVGMAFFFCGFMTHIIFFIFAAVSPPFTIGTAFQGSSFAFQAASRQCSLRVKSTKSSFQRVPRVNHRAVRRVGSPNPPIALASKSSSGAETSANDSKPGQDEPSNGAVSNEAVSNGAASNGASKLNSEASTNESLARELDISDLDCVLTGINVECFLPNLAEDRDKWEPAGKPLVDQQQEVDEEEEEQRRKTTQKEQQKEESVAVAAAGDATNGSFLSSLNFDGILETMLLISPFFFWGSSMVAMKVPLDALLSFASSLSASSSQSVLATLPLDSTLSLADITPSITDSTVALAADAAAAADATSVAPAALALTSSAAAAVGVGDWQLWESGEWWMLLAAQSMGKEELSA